MVAQHRLVAASETARDTAKAHYDYAHARLAGGIGRAIDEVRAQQDLATVETQLQANLVALARAREALGVLLAAPGRSTPSTRSTCGAAVDGARRSRGARTKRTDVRLLDVRVASAKRAADDIWGYYMPYLAAVGTAVRPAPADAAAADARLAGAAAC